MFLRCPLCGSLRLDCGLRVAETASVDPWLPVPILSTMATLLAFASVSTNCGCIRPVAQSSLGRRPSQPLQRGWLPQVAKPGARRFAPQAAAAAVAPPAQQAIRVKLSAYQVDLLNESVELIRTASQETGDCSMRPPCSGVGRCLPAIML